MKNQINHITRLIIALMINLLFICEKTNADLKSISVVFRHGDRLPDPSPKGFYPKDPYKNHNFEPVKLGGLTKVGKKRSYDFGVSLREKYKEFLKDEYDSNEVFAISTGFERTKMSLLLTLAGLYPPKKKQIWNDKLNWQPIPIHVIPENVPSFARSYWCPRYQEELKKVKSSEEYKKDLSRFGKLMKELETHTGVKDITDIESVFLLSLTLNSELSMNLDLPEWTKNYYPKGPILDAALFTYKMYSYNKNLTTMNGGAYVRKLLDNALEAKDRSGKKIFLYSCHEYNIGAILIALNLWKNLAPEYSSAVIFELHRNDSMDFLKILYYKGIPAEYEELGIYKVEDFIDANKEILPNDTMEACYGSPEDSLLIPPNADSRMWTYDNMKKWFFL